MHEKGFLMDEDNVKWTIVKGHSRRGNRLERVVLFVLFRDFSALSNSNLLKQATAKSDNLYSEKVIFNRTFFNLPVWPDVNDWHPFGLKCLIITL